MFQYTPNQVDRSGQLLGSGIASAGASLGKGLADAISNYRARADELKGYQQILKSYASDPNSGIDPDSIDKMDVGTAKGAVLAMGIKQHMQQQQQQADNYNVLAKYINGMGASMPDQTYAVPGGIGPQAPPEASPLKRSLLAVTPQLLQTPEGSRTVNTLLAQGMAPAATSKAALPPKAITLTNPVTGKPQAYSFSEATGKYEPMIEEKTVTANQPGGEPIYSKDGKMFWDASAGASGAWKPLRDKKSLMDGGDAAATVAPTLATLRSMKERGVKRVNIPSSGTPEEVGSVGSWWGSGENIDDAIARLSAVGGNTANNSTEPQPDISQADYKNLKAGDSYWFGGKQYTKK